jgi:glucosylglycerate synthase
MLREFRRGAAELGDIWDICLLPDTLAEIRNLASTNSHRGFHIDDMLWARVVMEFSLAYRTNPILRGQLVRSLTPLYLGRVASFVLQTENLASREVEDRIEELCMAFERLKPYLIRLWSGERPQHTNAGEGATLEPDSGGKSTLEVGNV